MSLFFYTSLGLPKIWSLPNFCRSQVKSVVIDKALTWYDKSYASGDHYAGFDSSTDMYWCSTISWERSIPSWRWEDGAEIMPSALHSSVATSLEKKSTRVCPTISKDPSKTQQQELLNIPKGPDAKGSVLTLWHSWGIESLGDRPPRRKVTGNMLLKGLLGHCLESLCFLVAMAVPCNSLLPWILCLTPGSKEAWSSNHRLKLLMLSVKCNSFLFLSSTVLSAAGSWLTRECLCRTSVALTLRVFENRSCTRAEGQWAKLEV